jgi:hypothetical protein
MDGKGPEKKVVCLLEPFPKEPVRGTTPPLFWLEFPCARSALPSAFVPYSELRREKASAATKTACGTV